MEQYIKIKYGKPKALKHEETLSVTTKKG